MNKKLFAATIALMGIIPFVIPSIAASKDEKTADSKKKMGKWEKHYYDRVDQFKKENGIKQNIVIVGSSHVEGIDSEKLLPRWKVVNRGIGSDRIGIDDRGILHRLDCSVFNCDPGVVVIQNGVNDLGELKRNGTPTIDEIDKCYRKVISKIRTRLPDTPLVIVGLFPTRDKYGDLVPSLLELDARQKKIAEDFGCTYLEMFSALSGPDGFLKKEYSREGLHLTEAGYKVWMKKLNDVLLEIAPQAQLPAADENTAPEK